MRTKLILIAVAAFAMLAVYALAPRDVALARSGPLLTAQLERSWPSSSPSREAAFSRDGRLLGTSNAAGDVIVRRIDNWRPVSTLRVPGGATSLAFGVDGTTLFTAGYDGIVRQWPVEGGRPSRELRGAVGALWALDVRPDGGELAAAGEDGIIRLWNLATGRARLLKGHQRNVWEVRYTPDGRALVSGSFDNSARIWREGRAPQVLRGHDEAVVGLDVSPDGRIIATGSDDSTVRLWDAASGAALRTLDAGNHAYDVQFSGDGRWLVTAGRARGALGTLWHQATGLGGEATPVHLWRMADGAAVAALPHPDDVMYAIFSPDGRHLVTSGEDGVRLWRLDPR